MTLKQTFIFSQNQINRKEETKASFSLKNQKREKNNFNKHRNKYREKFSFFGKENKEEENKKTRR